MSAREARRAAAALNIHDLEAVARRRLPRGLFDFIARGAEDEVTTRDNLRGLKRIALRQRVGVDVSRRDLSVSLFGHTQSMPVVVGVTGLSGMVAWRGEESIARAAAQAGIPYTIGTTNFASAIDIGRQDAMRLWVQLYPSKDRALLTHQVENARAAGAQVLVVTLDSPVSANREYLRRSGFSVPVRPTARATIDALMHPQWLIDTYFRHWRAGFPQLGNLPPGKGDLFRRGADLSALRTADDITWEELGVLRRLWDGPLVVKGVSTAEDAVLAAAQGIDGLIVSNHGGRSLDGCIASIDALPEVVNAVGERMTVMVDGGFLRGSDVVKALAIGAKAVMIGRATLYGLAAAGEAGAARAIAIFREEIDRALGLVGCTRIAELNPGHVRRPNTEAVP